MRTLATLFLAALTLWACQPADEAPTGEAIASPGNVLQLDFWLTDAGEPAYRLLRGETVVIDTSRLGFAFKDAPVLQQGLELLSSKVSATDETWEMVWGEQRSVRNHYTELRTELAEAGENGRKMNITFRLYDDGLGFRYEIPEQPGFDSILIADELTEFTLGAGDPTVWWIPGDWDIYEHVYNETRFSEIDALSKRDNPNLAQTYIPENAVNTPVTLKTEDGLYLSFHEANLTDYAGMTLQVDKENHRFTSELVGWADGLKVRRQGSLVTPWRTIQVAERAGDLIESKLIVNLNEPNKLTGDLSWIQPMKYAGIWWEMHLGVGTWDMASGMHSATTENTKRYIDFCAANNIQGLLVEGWNTGWEHWIGFDDREGVFDFVTPYADYDLEEVVRYGKEKGVDIIMHHETSAAPRTYDQQLDTAYALMQQLGIHAVKTGYVGKIIPRDERHHGQWMVNHYRRVLLKAAESQVMVDAHEPIKATGLRRTYPNMMAREGLRGQEFNAWSSEGGNPVNHLTVVAFTRMLAGPIDYTPGAFDLTLNPYKPDNRIRHTLAHELALYVVIYSPLQMMCDLPQHAEGQPGMQWVRDVAVDWDETHVIDGEPGDFVTIVRKERDGDRWFLGSIANEDGKDQTITLDFLDEGVSYRMVTYTDGEGAHWETDPYPLDIAESKVMKGETLELHLASGGGAAVMFAPIEE
ncbi:MAG: glycoside hydrolase family 97 protein, partial [Lewinella sp.]|nr:glycoside hydrolase family 97 protein [Lewinella sp.]